MGDTTVAVTPVSQAQVLMERWSQGLESRRGNPHSSGVQCIARLLWPGLQCEGMDTHRVVLEPGYTCIYIIKSIQIFYFVCNLFW